MVRKPGQRSDFRLQSYATSLKVKKRIPLMRTRIVESSWEKEQEFDLRLRHSTGAYFDGAGRLSNIGPDGKPFSREKLFHFGKRLFTLEQRRRLPTHLEKEVRQGSGPGLAAVAFLEWISIVQHQYLQIHGSVVEIGVHHGRYFIPIAYSATETEQPVAIDVFDKQHLNTDSSGEGDYKAFASNLQKFNIDPQNISIHGKSSESIDVGDLVGEKASGIRFASIDGGHTTKLSWSDMVLCAQGLTPSGVLAVDDFTNLDWPGAADGALLAIHDLGLAGYPLAPFAVAFNKLWVTTPTAHFIFLKLIEDHPVWGKCLKHFPQWKVGRVTHREAHFHLAGYPIVMERGCEPLDHHSWQQFLLHLYESEDALSTFSSKFRIW